MTLRLAYSYVVLMWKHNMWKKLEKPSDDVNTFLCNIQLTM